MSEADRQIGFEQLGIGAIIRNYRLSVPLHQREYSWTDKEVSDLLHDISKSISDQQPLYFLGSIVTIPKDGNRLEVVDGQQRLATTAILLAAIRDFLKPSKPDEVIVNDIHTGFLTTVDRQARETVSKLTLNVTDHEYFQKRIIDADDGTLAQAYSHRLLDDAARIAKEHVAAVAKSQGSQNYGDVLNKWIDYLEYKAHVVLLKVPSEINAYKMFETLNARGLRTSQSDLVKNYLFGQSGGRLNEAQQKWSGMRAVLESFEDDDITVNYLRQMLISMVGYLREDDVYENVTNRAKGVTQALNFLTKLETGANDYAAILNPEHQKWNTYPATIRRAIATLTLVRMRPMRPLMLAVAREFSEAEADRSMRLILRMSVRLIIGGGAKSAARSGTVEVAIAETARRVSEQKLSTAADILKELEAVIPKDSQFEEAFATTSVSNAKLARYYVRSLEMAQKKEPNPLFIPNDDVTVVNLEHVLPRKPGAHWPAFTEDEAEIYHRRLGNMALMITKLNSDLGNSSFEEKKAAFASSQSYELTRQITTLKQWTTAEISERQKKMAALAVKTWPLSAT